jgi:rubrerythrin
MTLREILEIAVQMETDGIKFYAAAASYAHDKDTKNTLVSLSEWEKKHREKFTKLKEQVIKTEEAIVNPDGEASLYLEAFATGAIFDITQNPLENLKPDTKVSDILKIAIALEKDAVCCYLGIKLLVADSQSKSKVDEIIKEEMEHIRVLSELLCACPQKN